MDQMVRRELPRVRRSRLLYRGQVVRDAVPMSIKRKKKKRWRSEEEIKDKNWWEK
jgi:hypothetical protein